MLPTHPRIWNSKILGDFEIPTDQPKGKGGKKERQRDRKRTREGETSSLHPDVVCKSHCH